MKHIKIMRHAEAESSRVRGDDADRQLTARGERMAKAAGKQLAEQGVVPDIFLCSHAIRAQQTANLVAKEVAFVQSKIQIEPTIYHATSVDVFFELFQRIDEGFNHLWLVGHNPYLSELSMALDFRSKVTMMQVAAVASFDLDIAYWAELNPGTATFLTCHDYFDQL